MVYIKNCEYGKDGSTMKKNIFSKGFIGAATVACVLLGAGIFEIPYYGNNFVPDSHVDIDVNPGVEIITNKNNKVIDILSTNNDGKAVIDGMNLKNSELKVAVNALIGSMVQKGYIENDNTGILVTVRNNNQDRADKVKAEVLDDINFALYKNDVQAAVMNQTLKNTKNADKFARENNVSIGKSVFVLNLASKDSTMDARELAKMRVSDIADLVVKKGIDIRDIVDYDYDDSIWENIADAIEDIDENANKAAGINAVALSSTKKQIGVEGAKQIALAHAKVALKDVTFIKAEIDYEDGIKVYDIDFYSGNVEYDYEINAATGSILSVDWDIEDYSIPAPEPAPTEVPAPAPAPTAAPSPTQPAVPSTISAERAKQIALSHAGVGGANFIKAELDTDDGVQVYEIEFKVENVEYEYDINAISGEIISSKSEVDD